MSDDRRSYNILFSILLALVLIFSPITSSGSKNDSHAFAQGTIAFTPNISTLQVTQTLIATPIPTIADEWYLEEGGFYIPSYERVTCVGAEEEVCFEICYMEDCYLFSGDDARVKRLIDKLEERKKYLEDLEVKRNELWPKITDTVGTCLQSIGGGLGIGATIVGIIAAVEPTQIVKTVAVVGAFVSVVGGFAICNSSIASTYSVGSEEQTIIENITSATDSAIFEFLDLRDRPRE